MARYHRRTKEPAWRRRLVINFTAGVYTALVVVIFAIVKFTEGAWLVVVVFPVLVFAFIRLNRRYRVEAEVLEDIGGRKPPDPPNYARRTVLVFVDEFNLATIAALRYARGLRRTDAASGAFRHRLRTGRRAASGLAARRARHSARPGGRARTGAWLGPRASSSPGRPASQIRM